MAKKDIKIWNLFYEVLQHNGNMLLMDGDIKHMSLSPASAYGELPYIKNKSRGGAKTINLMLNAGQWQAQLDADLANATNRTRKGSSGQTAARRSNKRSRT